MPESHPVQPATDGLDPSEQVYLNELQKFTPVDWQNWVERVCANQPRRPLTPIADTSLWQVFTYTHNLLESHAPLLKTTFVDTVFRKFAQTQAVAANAALLSKLIEVLQPMRPYGYRNNIETLVSNPYGAFQHLWWDNISLHTQLLSLYSTLHERKTDEYPDPFAIILHNQIGRHPDPKRFIEVSLQHFQEKQADHYFAFLQRLTKPYAAPEYVQNWVRAFRNLLRERLQDAHQLFRWFMASRVRYREQLESGAEPNPAYEQWERDLRLHLSIWIERRKFYRNNPFVVLLYCELISGIKPPLAPVLAMLCDLQPLPEYEQFEMEMEVISYRLLHQSLRKFGHYSSEPNTFRRKQQICTVPIRFYAYPGLSAVETSYEVSKYVSLFAPRFAEEAALSCLVSNEKRIGEMDDLASGLSEMMEKEQSANEDYEEGVPIPSPIEEATVVNETKEEVLVNSEVEFV